MFDVFTHRPRVIARTLERLRSDRRPALRAVRARGAAIDPRTVERTRAMLGCAVRGVDPSPYDGSR